MAAETVILNHDAAIDEYMATVLLTTMDDVELKSIVITNADCIADPAMMTAWKIQAFIGRTDIPLALSEARGYNPFPWPYRGDCVKEGAIGPLQGYGPNPDWPPYPNGEKCLTESLEQAPERSVTLLVTCPLTTIRMVLEGRPQLQEKIKHMIWMGGAIKVAGNLDPATLPAAVANSYAEWNAFWDPFAVDWCLRKTSFPITVFPLDVTNQAAITEDFLSRLLVQGKSFRYSNLALASYELVATESFYDMWDVVTTCYISRRDLFDEPQRMSLEIVTQGFDQGSLVQSPSGRPVDVVLNLANPDGFYDYVLEKFRRS